MELLLFIGLILFFGFWPVVGLILLSLILIPVLLIAACIIGAFIGDKD